MKDDRCKQQGSKTNVELLTSQTSWQVFTRWCLSSLSPTVSTVKHYTTITALTHNVHICCSMPGTLYICVCRYCCKSLNILHTYIQISANTTRFCLLWCFNLYKKTLVRRSSFSSSSSSCHGSEVTWQEVGCMCGLVCSLRPGSQNAIPPSGCVPLPSRLTAATHWHEWLISCHVTSLQTSFDEGLWQRSKRQGKQSLVVLAVIFI